MLAYNTFKVKTGPVKKDGYKCSFAFKNFHCEGMQIFKASRTDKGSRSVPIKPAEPAAWMQINPSLFSLKRCRNEYQAAFTPTLMQNYYFAALNRLLLKYIRLNNTKCIFLCIGGLQMKSCLEEEVKLVGGVQTLAPVIPITLSFT